MKDDLARLMEDAPDIPPPKETEGVKLARANRRECNDLTEDQREDLVQRAMAAIYGDSRTQVRP